MNKKIEEIKLNYLLVHSFLINFVRMKKELIKIMRLHYLLVTKIQLLNLKFQNKLKFFIQF